MAGISQEKELVTMDQDYTRRRGDQDEIADLEQQVQEWKHLYEGLATHHHECVNAWSNKYDAMVKMKDSTIQHLCATIGDLDSMI